jgi:hypothetical protein|tara:strand:+ start:374 stop:829 length:456 start_codon:yes stop_codon:yes gene_type:complete
VEEQAQEVVLLMLTKVLMPNMVEVEVVLEDGQMVALELYLQAVLPYLVLEVVVEATVMEEKQVQQRMGQEDSGGHILLVVLPMVLLRMQGMGVQEQVGYLAAEMVEEEENPMLEMVAQEEYQAVEAVVGAVESLIKEMDMLVVVGLAQEAK